MTRAEVLSLGGGHAWVTASVVPRGELDRARAWVADRRMTGAMKRAKDAWLRRDRERQEERQAAADKQARELKEAELARQAAERKREKNKAACKKQRENDQAEAAKRAQAAKERSKKQYAQRKQAKAAKVVQAWWRGVLARRMARKLRGGEQ